MSALRRIDGRQRVDTASSVLQAADVRAAIRRLPAATACFLDDFAACIAHLKLPLADRKATRTTNLLERLFGEERRVGERLVAVDERQLAPFGERPR